MGEQNTNKFFIITALLNIFIVTSFTKANTADLKNPSTDFQSMNAKNASQQLEGLRDCVVWIRGGLVSNITTQARTCTDLHG